jgi:DNA-directed RNA polymerase alpha subunit
MKPNLKHYLPLPVTCLNLTEKEKKALKILNVHTFADFYKIEKYDFIMIKGFGRTSLDKMRDKIAEWGIVIPDTKKI